MKFPFFVYKLLFFIYNYYKLITIKHLSTTGRNFHKTVTKICEYEHGQHGTDETRRKQPLTDNIHNKICNM